MVNPALSQQPDQVPSVYSLSQEGGPKIIGDSLKRKTVSDQYHSHAYPSFLRANGPYRVYDHAEAQGPREHEKMQNINEQAADRFNEELEQIRNLKEFQKTEFTTNGINHDMILQYKRDLRTLSNAQNKNFLMDQMQNRAERAREFNMREKLYYKPHFGPEETDSQVELEEERRTNQKAYVKGNLNLQMDFAQTRKHCDRLKERADDLENLKVAQEMFLAEERAME